MWLWKIRSHNKSSSSHTHTHGTELYSFTVHYSLLYYVNSLSHITSWARHDGNITVTARPSSTLNSFMSTTDSRCTLLSDWLNKHDDYGVWWRSCWRDIMFRLGSCFGRLVFEAGGSCWWSYCWLIHVYWYTVTAVNELCLHTSSICLTSFSMCIFFAKANRIWNPKYCRHMQLNTLFVFVSHTIILSHKYDHPSFT